MAEKMGWEELSTTQEFASLTTKQKLAVCTYIENGYDIIHAIRTAYDCKSDHTAKIMSYRFFRCFNVAMCLSLHFGEEPQETFLNQLARDIAKGNISSEQLRAYTLYAEVRGWKKTAIVQAYEMAKDLDLYNKNPHKRHTRTNQKVINEVEHLISEVKKTTPKEPDFDLTHFESDEP